MLKYLKHLNRIEDVRQKINFQPIYLEDLLNL